MSAQTADVIDVKELVEGTSLWKDAWRRLKKNRLAVFGGLLLILMTAAVLIGPLISNYTYDQIDLNASNETPSWSHWFGTDQLGRDILSRLIYGARVSLIVGVMGTVVAGGLGTALGIVSGYLGGWVDQVIMRLTDAWLALPALVFAIFLATLFGPSMWNIVTILGLVYWTRYARVIRGEVLSLKERDFVRLAIVAGCSRRTIMRRHILPNVLNSAIVLGTLMLGVVVVTEAALSFLGVGVPPPKPAWGLMLADGKKGMMTGYYEPVLKASRTPQGPY